MRMAMQKEVEVWAKISPQIIAVSQIFFVVLSAPQYVVVDRANAQVLALVKRLPVEKKE